MYKVDVTSLKSQLIKLDKLIDTYEDNYINFFYLVKETEEYWSDPHALMFFEDKKTERISIDESYRELESISDLLDTVVTKYGKLGNFVQFDLNGRSEILSKFNTYINKLNRILNSYNSLDYGFASSDIKSAINQQINSVRTQINEANDLRDELKNIMDDISDNEKLIAKTLASLNINQLQAMEIDKYSASGGSIKEMTSVIDEEKVSTTVEKLQTYRTMESTNFVQIISKLNEITELYETNNTKLFEEDIRALRRKFDTINNYNNSTIDVYEKNVIKYHNVDSKLTSDAERMV